MNARPAETTRGPIACAATRIATASFAVVLAIAPVHAPRIAAAATNETLHLAINESPSSLDPLFVSTVDEQTLAKLAFDTLLDLTPEGRFVPNLATVVPTLANGGISRDGKTITFHLRSGVRWQDDKPFTSTDVAFTAREVLDPKVPIGDRTGYDQIASIETPDATTVVFHLKNVFASFVETVGTQFAIVPEHLLASSPDLAKDPFAANPIGTGPYKFLRQNRGDRVEYVANDGYWNGAPKIARIDVAEIPSSTTQALGLRQGSLDYAATSSNEFAQLRRDPNLVAAITPINDFVAYAINVTRPIVRDVDMRRAISMAVDRDALVRDDTFGTGTPAYADLAPFVWTKHEPKNPYGYNPARANALLERIGWRRGPGGIRTKDGTRLHLDAIDFSGSVTGRNIDVQVQQMLHVVGIELDVKYFSPSLYYAPIGEGGSVAKGDYDLAGYTFAASPEPQNDELYGCSHREPSGYNAARYCSPEMERLQTASLAELDPNKRLADVAKIETLAASDVPYVFLYHTPYRVIHAKRLLHSAASVGVPIYRIQDWSFAP